MGVKSKYSGSRGYVEALASQGLYHFTSRAAQDALGTSPDAVKLALNRLRRQGLIAMPARGFYVIVPPEYRSLECLPAEQFIPELLERKGLHYYAGLLSAAQYYGAAHHRPQEFQVFLEKNRRPIRCGKVRVAFFARKQIAEVPVRNFNTARGEIKISTPESTAIDLVGYPLRVGGLDQVATILSELADEIDPSLLPIAAATGPLPWAQRLGYLLELVEVGDVAGPLRKYVQRRAYGYTPLVPGLQIGKRQHSRNWKIVVNAEVELDV